MTASFVLLLYMPGVFDMFPSFGFADCRQLLVLLATGAGDSSLSVRIPTAAALAALSEALRWPQPDRQRCLGLHDIAKGASPPSGVLLRTYLTGSRCASTHSGPAPHMCHYLALGACPKFILAVPALHLGRMQRSHLCLIGCSIDPSYIFFFLKP